MSTKHLRTISVLLPLVAISATAHAGSTISDKSYWPSEAYDRSAPRLQPATSPNEAGSAWRYQGGPKSR